MPIFPEHNIILKCNEQKLIKVNAPFIDKTSGLAIVKILHGGSHSTLALKLKFMQNEATLDITNKGTHTMIFKPEEMIGIIDPKIIRILQNQQGILQQNLSRYYKFERAEKLCEYFNNFINTFKKERKQNLLGDKYTWLDQDNERRHMKDKENF